MHVGYLVSILYFCLKQNMMVDDTIPGDYLACPIRQVISKFGDKWSLVVLYSIYNAQNSALRYRDIKSAMWDCSPKMLSATLKNLERIGLISRVAYPEVPPRVEYSLTGRGKSLMPNILSLIDWAKRNCDITPIRVTE